MHHQKLRTVAFMSQSLYFPCIKGVAHYLFLLQLISHNFKAYRSYNTKLARKITIAMNLKGTVLFFFLVLIIMSSVEGLGDNSDCEEPLYSMYKENGVHVHSRKLLMLDAVLDYDDARPNPKHDPRGRRGGRNP
ncbi:hypothetical protein LIER_27045 [Lithospermum erythrorhizon]|uniref:Uncharacterized protein n=1 Tax=Lithospermum erythrorhizon TaxID=34254 RepID=A0AAV3RBU4_LITER